MSSVPPVQIEIRTHCSEKLMLMDGGDFVIGRSSKLRVSVETNNISREHLRVQVLNGKLWVTDLSSTNGTFLGGRRLQAQVSVEYKGEELCMGPLGEGVYLKLSLVTEDARSSLSQFISQGQPRANTGSLSSSAISSAAAKASQTSSKIQSVPSQQSGPGGPKPIRQDEKSYSIPSLSKGMTIDSGFLVNRPKAEEGKQSGASGRSVASGGNQFDAYAIEVESKKKELIELEKRRLAAERQMAEVDKAKTMAESMIRQAEQKRDEQLEIERQIAALRVKAGEAEARIGDLKIEEKRQQDLINDGLKRAEEAKRQKQAIEQMVIAEEQRFDKRREQLDAAYRQEEHRIESMRQDLAMREAELGKRAYEVQAEVEKLQHETDFLKKRILLEKETLQAEAQLKKTQSEKELEELRTKKIAMERELETLVVRSETQRASLESQHEQLRRIEDENRTHQNVLNELRSTINGLEGKKKQLDTETQGLQDRINAANEEAQRILTHGRMTAEDSIHRAKDEAKEIVDEGLKKVAAERARSDEEIRIYRENTDREFKERHQKMQHEIAEDRKAAEAFIQREKSDWNREYDELKTKALREQEGVVKAWKSEMDNTRQKDLEALSLWRAEQDKRVREKLAADVDGLVHAVATTALAKLQAHPNQVLSQNELINTLEPALKDALVTEASTHGPFNPNREAQTKNFWIDFGKKAAIAASVLVALWTVPKFVMSRFEEVKANRSLASDSSDVFVQRLREARKRALELNLQMRDEFQESYVDNVLYNDAYLEIKQDPEIQKEWVIKLYQFFFEVLQLPDRVVVDFIPLEGGVIRSLSDLRKSMNARNFKQNLDQMRAAEKKKMEEIVLLLGTTFGDEVGRENWNRIRNLESEFYQEKLRKLPPKSGEVSAPEEPASGESAPETEGSASVKLKRRARSA